MAKRDCLRAHLREVIATCVCLSHAGGVASHARFFEREVIDLYEEAYLKVSSPLSLSQSSLALVWNSCLPWYRVGLGVVWSSVVGHVRWRL